ncbi:hypothetical protein OO013_11005 [Mangrovivirga sp. M17]|uniref:Uncharacterized protein n=1 Tax=Mangrovivirga halotolerans TaxID=2993936 RepID=A0ABT3RSS0_9BACT|nr:hypothetical protein [Mangrovivirga halotolerans]MCX2744399.1 hypothetical protein [Mangrovivirga halotolerans]
MIFQVNKRYFLLVAAVFFSCLSTIKAQNIDLESIGKEKPLTVNGGISVNQIFYKGFGIENRRDPYSYFLSGNLNLTIFGISAPVSFAYSNQQVSFRQPFNRLSISPRYKWATAHIGVQNQTFSSYTLAGHTFSGGGLELTPGKWQIKAVYGRFLKAAQPDSTQSYLEPAYQRMGYGLQSKYNGERLQAGFSFFHAKDDSTSINLTDSLYSDITPEENLAMSVDLAYSITKNLRFNIEYGTSILTRNIGATNKYFGNNAGIKIMDAFYNANASTAVYDAINGALNYTFGKYIVGLTYERVDPGYESHGAYFFNNDLETIAVTAASSLFEGKVNLNINVGTQRNNLEGDEASATSRLSGAVGVGYAPSERLNLQFNYSSYQTYTNIRPIFDNINALTPYDNLDTLNYRQISQQANMNVAYVLSTDKERPKNINLNVNYQGTDDEQGGTEQNTGLTFINANAVYSMGWTPSSTQLSLSMNYNVNNSAGLNNGTYGPSVSVAKSFLDRKLRTSLATSYNRTYGVESSRSEVLTARVSGNYTLAKKHRFNLNGTYASRNAPEQEFSELTITFGYNYSF